MVAHRLSTIINFDKIAVVSQGKIEDMGSHSELLKSSLHYQKCVLRKR